MRLVGAGHSAGRHFIVLYPFVAEVALHRHLRVFIKLHSPERTGLDTFLALDTERFLYEHYSLLVPGDGVCRARIPAGRFCAVVTIYGDEMGAILNHPAQPRTLRKFQRTLGLTLNGLGQSPLQARSKGQGRMEIIGCIKDIDMRLFT